MTFKQKNNKIRAARNILVTGGAGYIGSHTSLQLLQAGYAVTVLDNLSDSARVALDRVQELTGQEVLFVEGDVNDPSVLSQLFAQTRFDAVIHFAGFQAVAQPLRCYHNNVAGTLALLKAMDAAGCRSLVFSSSATVYGDPQRLPITEGSPRSATNPYGRSKLMIEALLEDVYKPDPRWRIACLRYFNPVGAHPSGPIGEDPQGMPNNLLPFMSQVACGMRSKLSVFGDDYPTPDSTGVRDYIHVVDLATGHLAALDYLQGLSAGELLTENLGTGHGVSVLDIIKTFEAESGQAVPYEMVARRPGDIAACYADANKAKGLFGWEAKLDLRAMCADTWRWQSNNPRGYGNVHKC